MEECKFIECNSIIELCECDCLLWLSLAIDATPTALTLPLTYGTHVRGLFCSYILILTIGFQIVFNISNKTYLHTSHMIVEVFTYEITNGTKG